MSLLNRATLATFDLFEDRLKEQGLALGAWRILAVLHKTGSLRVREVLRLTGLERPTLSRLLADLERRALIVRTQSDDDARGVIVQPTREGLALTNRLAPHTLRAEMELLRGFTGDERDFLVRLLKRMLVNLLPPVGAFRGADEGDSRDESFPDQSGGPGRIDLGSPTD